jgi:predicted transcriptional regulator of viral defense system
MMSQGIVKDFNCFEYSGPTTMLDALLQAVGRTRRGKSVDQLQNQLGWTKVQIRNALYRASARGLLETVRPGRYRQTV